jgi:formate dehydrogenase assembly factor FdhD
MTKMSKEEAAYLNTLVAIAAKEARTLLTNITAFPTDERALLIGLVAAQSLAANITATGQKLTDTHIALAQQLISAFLTDIMKGQDDGQQTGGPHKVS